MITVMIEYSDFQMIMISFTLSEFLDSEKKSIERELAFSKEIMNSFLSAASVFLMKNSFLTDLLIFHFLIFSVTLMIQSSAFLKVLFSDSSKSAFSILLFMTDLLMSAFLIFLL